MSFTLKIRDIQREEKAAVRFPVLYKGRGHRGEKKILSLYSKNVSTTSTLKLWVSNLYRSHTKTFRKVLLDLKLFQAIFKSLVVLNHFFML